MALRGAQGRAKLLAPAVLACPELRVPRWIQAILVLVLARVLVRSVGFTQASVATLTAYWVGCLAAVVGPARGLLAGPRVTAAAGEATTVALQAAERAAAAVVLGLAAVATSTGLISATLRSPSSGP